MNKLDLESKNLVDTNIELIAQLFPHCITEQDGKKVVDFNKLKDEFTDEIACETKEKYELNWPGKRAAINESRIKTTKTLLPLEEKSVNFEDTNNVYIEGDNLEVLKLLQESYLNKIKCIYIDPPYNTGKDFIYKDDFKQSVEDELLDSGQIDEKGNKFVQNTETNGRYHSDWLSMMYPRLKLARNLLKEDGVIFISIDDNEYDNLKKICDEIFGESNFAASITRIANKSGSAGIAVRNTSDKCMIYLKNSECFISGGKEKADMEFQFSDEFGPYNKGRELNKWGTDSRREDSPTMYFPIIDKYGRELYPIRNDGSEGRWRFGKETMNKMLASNDVLFDFEKEIPRAYEKIRGHKTAISQYKNLFDDVKYQNARGNGRIKDLFGQFDGLFSFPKPVELVYDLIEVANLETSDIVLDFFSGSASTADAVMQYNIQKQSQNKYIMVQLPESIDEKNSKSAYDFCIENDLEPIIPSIAQERIKRAGAKIKEETGADIDYGFRVFKLSDSILKANEVLPNELQQELLFESDSKYVEGISKLDIVTSVILDLGLMLDSKIKELDNDNFVIEEDLLFISLSEVYDKSILDSIRDIMPDQVVLDEKTFDGNDALMTNVIQQINEISSDITINIL